MPGVRRLKVNVGYFGAHAAKSIVLMAKNNFFILYQIAYF